MIGIEDDVSRIERERGKVNKEQSERLLNKKQLPCPHGRPSWKMCPHCLGLNKDVRL